MILIRLPAADLAAVDGTASAARLCRVMRRGQIDFRGQVMYSLVPASHRTEVIICQLRADLEAVKRQASQGTCVDELPSND
jgi:hypothetical protein